jgi:hypothetical protein
MSVRSVGAAAPFGFADMSSQDEPFNAPVNSRAREARAYHTGLALSITKAGARRHRGDDPFGRGKGGDHQQSQSEATRLAQFLGHSGNHQDGRCDTASSPGIVSALESIIVNGAVGPFEPGGTCMPFANRTEAGCRLARALVKYDRDPVVVLALPRGGVPVAADVAAAL